MHYEREVGGFVYSDEAIASRLKSLDEQRRSLVAEEWSIQEQIDQLQKQLEVEQDPMAEMTIASQIGELNEAIDEKEAEVVNVDKKIADFEHLSLSASFKESE